MSNNKKLVLEYLVKENRPHSAQDVLTSFDTKMGKTAVTKALEELAEEKKIIEKVYGKQKVYMALQNIDSATLKSKLRDLDEKLVTSKADLNRLKNENQKNEAELRGHEQVVPIGVLKEKLKELNEQVEEASEKLKKLKSGSGPVISSEQRAKVQKEHEKYAKEWRKLKRITNEMMATILDNCNMKKKDLVDELCLVLDEHENVEPPKI